MNKFILHSLHKNLVCNIKNKVINNITFQKKHKERKNITYNNNEKKKNYVNFKALLRIMYTN